MELLVVPLVFLSSPATTTSTSELGVFLLISVTLTDQPISFCFFFFSLFFKYLSLLVSLSLSRSILPLFSGLLWTGLIEAV